MLRRHPILVVVSLVLLTGATALAVVLATFDLDLYRSDLEQSLGAALHRPVHLGHARFALHGGIALEFSDIHIGDREETGIVSARFLALRLDLLPLLIGHFSFGRLIIDQPDILLALPPPVATTPPATESQPIIATFDALLETTLVRRLHVRDGHLRLLDRRHSGTERIWEIDTLSIQLRNLGQRGPIEIDCAGNLRFGTTPAPFDLSGTLDLPGKLRQWRNGKLDLTLDAGPVDTKTANALGLIGKGGHLDGRAGVHVRLNGIPAEGLDFSGELHGEELRLALPALYRTPLAIELLRLDGRWTSREAEQELTLRIHWNSLRLDSHTRWRQLPQGEETVISLTLPETPLKELARLLPDVVLPEPLQLLQRSLRSGTLTVPALQFAIEKTHAAAPAVTLQKCLFRVAAGEMDVPGLGLATGIVLSGLWHDGRLSIDTGAAEVAGGPLQFSGSIAAAPEPTLTLKADGRCRAATLLANLNAGAKSDWRAAGAIPYTLAINGPVSRLLVDFKADLAATELAYGGSILKQAQGPGELLVAGILLPERLELSHLRLAIPLADLRAEGALDRRAPYPGRLSIDLTRLDLAALHSDIGALNLLQPHGDIGAHLNIVRTADGALRHDGLVTFRNLALHLGGAVADVSQASGRIRIDANELNIEHVSGLVGSSLLSGSGSLGRIDAIRLDLTVHGEAVHARDLVFRSEQLLRAVGGRVVIDGNGIDFIDARADLGDGTRATVNGTLRNFAAPQIELDVVAERAVVADVVNLWQGPAHLAAPATSPDPHGGGITVTVRALARKGDVYGLLFSDGEGIIRYRDGRLTVEPLRLKSGAGHCTAQVTLRDLHAEHALLTISGHLVNADAAGVYTQLLKSRGLVTGALSGDFFLAGRTGNFFASANGGGSVRIDNGVLLRFPVLAKVFSVLNVSQIFALRLPDMAQEGMPFDRIEATFSVNQGVLRTEDFITDSPAMNLALVGNFDLGKEELDCVLGVKPLRTVDKIISSIPLAGWVLTGKEKALVTAQFTIKGPVMEPEVKAAPISTLSDLAVGFFKRAFGLPGKVIDDLGALGTGQ